MPSLLPEGTAQHFDFFFKNQYFSCNSRQLRVSELMNNDPVRSTIFVFRMKHRESNGGIKTTSTIMRPKSLYRVLKIIALVYSERRDSESLGRTKEKTRRASARVPYKAAPRVRENDLLGPLEQPLCCESLSRRSSGRFASSSLSPCSSRLISLHSLGASPRFLHLLSPLLTYVSREPRPSLPSSSHSVKPLFANNFST